MILNNIYVHLFLSVVLGTNVPNEHSWYKIALKKQQGAKYEEFSK